VTQKAKEIRKTIIEMANRAKSPHVGSALSCADILSALYFRVMDIPVPFCEKRDYFLLSKAHSAMALYATLFHKGVMSKEQIDGYYQNNGTLPAHTDRFLNDFVEISAGSLGHGLPMGLGLAHSMKLRNETNKVFVLMGDGEMQEGSVWEAAMLAPKLGLNNLVALIDRNNLQGYGRATDLVHFYPIEEKWISFGWDAVTVDGHDEAAIVEACKTGDKPKVVICDTTKGKGVSFMEDQLAWHYYLVQDNHKAQAMEELK
jgi:transketolase